MTPPASRPVDLLVAGGGPAGLATAIRAARSGLDVVVLEPRTGPIDKACGEGLMPGAVAALRAIGVDPVGRPLAGIRYLDGRASAQAAFRDGPGRGVRRTALHRALLGAATTAGVVVDRRTVGRVEQDADGVSVDGRRARYLVAADGLHSPIRRALGLDGPAAPLRRFGLRQHVRTAPWSDHVEVHWGEGCEAYVTPVADDLVGVALLTSVRGGYAEQLAKFPVLRERIGDAAGGEVRGAGPLRQRAKRRTSGRVLLVGDAAGYVDALTGEGVALALAQARVAVHAVLAERPGDYERDWQAVTRRYRVLTAGLLGATRWRPARRMLVPAAARFPAAFSTTVNALARPG